MESPGQMKTRQIKKLIKLDHFAVDSVSKAIDYMGSLEYLGHWPGANQNRSGNLLHAADGADASPHNASFVENYPQYV